MREKRRRGNEKKRSQGGERYLLTCGAMHLHLFATMWATNGLAGRLEVVP